jgi:heme exporter protein A
VLFGRNGAGKSTFLHIAATLMTPSSGELFYGGRLASDDPAGVRRQIGLVSHASFLYSDLTVRENLEFYTQLYGLSDPEAVIEEALTRADLRWRADSLVRSLSRGMHQRLTIARALLHKPTLLLLDEPYTGLDPISAERFSTQILELRDSKAAVILTTHDLGQGLEVADRVVILESGRIAYEGKGGQDPDQFRKTFAEVTRK